MSKHTPGPWAVAGPFLNSKPIRTKTCVSLLGPEDQHGGQIIIGHIYYKVPNDAELEGQFKANIRLIAAAPDLLEACKMLAAVGKEYSIDLDTMLTFGPSYSAALKAIASAALQAIAKAEEK